MYKEIIAKYSEILKDFGCAIAIFTEEGIVLHLNEEAIGVFGRSVINMELLPGRYVENEDFWENVRSYKTVFTHKALLKAGADTYKIRGMVHELYEGDANLHEPAIYALAFEIRDDRIFGSVTLERIVENSGFVAFHWVMNGKDEDQWYVKYVSKSISKFGYKREDFYDKKVTIRDTVYKEDYELLKDEIVEHLHNGKYEYNRQYRVVDAEGRVIPVHDYVHLVTDGAGELIGLEVVIFDLLMETERNASLLLLENALNRSSNMVLVWEFDNDNEKDSLKHIKYASNNLERLGISPSLLREGVSDYWDYLYEDDKERVLRTYEEFEQEGYQYLSQEYRIVDKNGQIFWVRDESNLVELPGGMRYIESILTDVSDAKQREIRLLETQNQLEKKLRYIESDSMMLNDLSVADFISVEELQELQGAVATLTKSYNAIIDLNGNPITYPEGPSNNMGSFYDMFERQAYKKAYFELNTKIQQTKQPMKILLDEFMDSREKTDIHNGEEQMILPMDGSLAEAVKAASPFHKDSTPGVMIGIPLLVNGKQLATWINCAFTPQEMQRMDSYIPSLWTFCKYMADFVYSNTISQKQKQKARLSEVQTRDLLERNQIIRNILNKCNESNDKEVIGYVLRKVSAYLKLSRIALFEYDEYQDIPDCIYDWDGISMKEDSIWNSEVNPAFFAQQKKSFERDGEVILQGDKMPTSVRRIMMQNHIRAIVALPIRTNLKKQYYIIFAENTYERTWTEDELSFMRTTVSVLQSFLQRIRSNVSIDSARDSYLKYLQISREYIYIKDKETNEIVYVNPRLEEIVGKDAVGKKCFEVFRKQFIHCVDCYEKNGECTEISQCRMYRHFFKKPMHICEMDIDWSVGNRMVVISRED